MNFFTEKPFLGTKEDFKLTLDNNSQHTTQRFSRTPK